MKNNLKMTMNGLSEEKFQDLKNGLSKDAEFIIKICNSDTGHLGDIVSGIRTIQSSLDIKANKLWEIFSEQIK